MPEDALPVGSPRVFERRPLVRRARPLATMNRSSRTIYLLPVGVDERIAPEPSFLGQQLVSTLRFPPVVGAQECNACGGDCIDATLGSTRSALVISADDAKHPIRRERMLLQAVQR